MAAVFLFSKTASATAFSIGRLQNYLWLSVRTKAVL
jgi:hypothetical protein